MKHSVARIAQQSRRVAGKAGWTKRALQAARSVALIRDREVECDSQRDRESEGERARWREMGLIPGNAIARLKWRSPVYFDVHRSSLPSPCWVFISVRVKIDPSSLAVVLEYENLDEDRFNNFSSLVRQAKWSNQEISQSFIWKNWKNSCKS